MSSRSSFLIEELLLGKLGETVAVHGNASHDPPRFLVCHLVGNRASFLCTEAPMIRVPKSNFLDGHQIDWCPAGCEAACWPSRLRGDGGA